MFRFFTLITLSVFVSSCAITPDQDVKLKKYLKAECYELITRPGVANYKYHATHAFPLVFAYFALASDDDTGKQVCAFVTVSEAMGKEHTSKVVALARCDAMRVAHGVKSPCKIFARNYDIVYDKENAYEME